MDITMLIAKIIFWIFIAVIVAKLVMAFTVLWIIGALIVGGSGTYHCCYRRSRW